MLKSGTVYGQAALLAQEGRDHRGRLLGGEALLQEVAVFTEGGVGAAVHALGVDDAGDESGCLRVAVTAAVIRLMAPMTGSLLAPGLLATGADGLEGEAALISSKHD